VKISKSRKTIRSELRWYLIGLVVLLVFFYTILLQEYFIRGVNIATKIEFEIIAREYNKQITLKPNTSLPTKPYLTTYRDWSKASSEYQLLFPVSEHQNNKLDAIEKYQNQDNVVTEYLFMRYLLNNNDYLYLVANYPPDMLNQQQSNELDNTILITFPLALVFIVVALLLIFHLGRKISRSSDALSHWAEQLTLDTIDHKRPEFHYADLNNVADQLQHAFRRIARLLEKEQQFLQFTSHELRTPLAITSANIEVLEKLGIEKQYEIQIARIKRANSNMQHITEALLWLSRENETIPQSESIIVINIIEGIIKEHQNLLQNKNVDINLLQCSDEIRVPLALFKIIISNLIRNAFQYTSEGSITIDIIKNTISITNQNHIADTNFEDNNDHNFGLGLDLVKQLIDKLGWKIEENTLKCGRIVCITVNL